MRRCRTEPARQARRAFRGAGVGTRIHTAVRQWVAPLDEFEALVPRTGRILDFGCGNGLFTLQMALSSAQRSLHGVDISGYKLRQATAAAEAAGVADRVSLEAVDPGWTPAPDSYDVVVVNDVLYLQRPEDIAAVVEGACAALRPDGHLVIKEIAPRPRWKHAVGMAEEVLAVRVLRITKGAALTPDPLRPVLEVLSRAGWSWQLHPMHRGYHQSHMAVVAVGGA